MMMFVEHSSEGYLPVRIVSEGHDGQTLVEGEICGINEQWWVSAATEQHRYDTLLNLAPDNLLSLADYTYAALLHALRLRHRRHEPYTWIGNVLVSINPCTDLGSFSPDMVRQFRATSSSSAEVMPHPFALVNMAVDPIKDGNPAAILVTGESGAGKTEAVKAMLSFLVERQGTQNDRVCGVLVGSTQALEAFGNARTLQNGNSSRFGKLTQVFLDPATGRARGAAVVPYMLEASRVTHHARGEMNYHIFYVLSEALQRTAGNPHGEFWGRSDLHSSWLRLSEIASNVGLADSQYLASLPSQCFADFHSSPRLAQSPRPDNAPMLSSRLQSKVGIEGGACEEQQALCTGCLEDIVQSLGAVGLIDDDILAALQVVLAVALLGNVSVADVLPGEVAMVHEADDSCDAAFGSPDAAAGRGRCHTGQTKDKDALLAVAELLAVPFADLQEFLATRTTDAPRCGERFVQARTTREVLTLRDSMAREVYIALFVWLVRRVAAAAAPQDTEALGQSGDKHQLAILDIYGFEVCQINGLEQMLINYCNERLQALFNAQMFAAEAREYEAEELPLEVWVSLCQTHELPALPLFEGGEISQRRFPGLFALVDDEARCRFNDGSSTALRSKMDAALSAFVGYKACRSVSSFAVSHFAGDVVYDSRNFIETNANAARPEILSFFTSASSSDFLRRVLGTRMEPSRQETNGLEVNTARRRQLFGRTVVQAFRAELDQLVNSFEKENTSCYYLRCLKPNSALKPVQFDGGSVLRQCRYSGLLETVQIRQRGFPHRRPTLEFLQRYSPTLWPEELLARNQHIPRRWHQISLSQQAVWASSVARYAVQAGDLEQDDIIVGRSKVFMRSRAFTFLEVMFEVATASVLPLQAAYRRHLYRFRYRASRKIALRLQAFFRGARARKLVRQYRGLVRLQACWRGYRIRRAVRAHLEVRAAEDHAAATIQRFFRATYSLRKRRAAIAWLRKPGGSMPPQALHQALRCSTRQFENSQPAAKRIPDFRIVHSDAKENRPPGQKKAVPRSGSSSCNFLKPPKEAASPALSARAAMREAQEQNLHKVQMDAVEAQFESLRQHRVQLLRDLAEARPMPSFMTQHGRGEASRVRLTTGTPSSSVGTASVKRKVHAAVDASTSGNWPPATPSPRTRAADPWAAFAVNRREHANHSGITGTPASAPAASPQSSGRKQNPSSRVVPGTRPSNARSVSPASERAARKTCGDIVQELRARCGNISAVQQRIEKDFGPDSPAGPRGSRAASRSRLKSSSPDSRRACGYSCQETRQISPAPSRPRSGFSTPGPPSKQVMTPPSKRAATAMNSRRSPCRRMTAVPANQTVPHPSPQRPRQSDIRAQSGPSPMRSTLREGYSWHR